MRKACRDDELYHERKRPAPAGKGSLVDLTALPLAL